MSKRIYRGIFGRTARRRCPHMGLRAVDNKRWPLYCEDCHRYLDGYARLALLRVAES